MVLLVYCYCMCYSLLLLYVLLFVEQGALGVDMVEYVLSGSPTRKELDARLRGKGGPPPPFIQNVSFVCVNISTTIWCCKFMAIKNSWTCKDSLF